MIETVTLYDVAVFLFLFTETVKFRTLLLLAWFKKRSSRNMIEIENETNRNLKNVKQIGTPREENKIYIENMAYTQIREDGCRAKNVFVLMGHTEHMEGRYATFIEAAIWVRGIEFSGGIPRWNNSSWSETFREIKRLYEDMIIVGWALDIKGMSPKMTPDLERVHREHFGGVHQLLFLLDSLENEEQFYIYKENKLICKDGFYIYHKARHKEKTTTQVDSERIPITVLPEKRNALRHIEPEVDVALEIPETEYRRGGKYRQLIQEQNKSKADNGNLGIAVAVAALVFVIGAGVYENSSELKGKWNSIQTSLLNNIQSTEVSGENIDEESTEVTIEIEIVPGSE